MCVRVGGGEGQLHAFWDSGGGWLRPAAREYAGSCVDCGGCFESCESCRGGGARGPAMSRNISSGHASWGHDWLSIGPAAEASTMASQRKSLRRRGANVTAHCFNTCAKANLNLLDSLRKTWLSSNRSAGNSAKCGNSRLLATGKRPCCAEEDPAMQVKTPLRWMNQTHYTRFIHI